MNLKIKEIVKKVVLYASSFLLMFIIGTVLYEEKYDALKKLMKHYHSEGFAFNTDMMKVTIKEK